MAPQGEGRALGLEDFVDQSLVELLEQLLLEPVDVLVELLDHREILVHRLVDDGVHRHLGTTRELIGVPRQAVARRVAARAVDRVYGDEETLAQEKVKIERLEIVGIGRRVIEADAGDDDEDVAVVLLQLYPRAGREGVLDRQGVELKDLLEQRVLVHVRAVDVYPQRPLPPLHDAAQVLGREVLVQHPVGAAEQAGGPVLGGRIGEGSGGGHE